jgi:hypothetical protein
LRYPVNIEVHDISQGRTIRNWLNSGSNEFFNNAFPWLLIPQGEMHSHSS